MARCNDGRKDSIEREVRYKVHEGGRPLGLSSRGQKDDDRHEEYGDSRNGCKGCHLGFAHTLTV